MSRKFVSSNNRGNGQDIALRPEVNLVGGNTKFSNEKGPIIVCVLALGKRKLTKLVELCHSILSLPASTKTIQPSAL